MSASGHGSLFWTQSPRGGTEERGSVGRAVLTGSRLDDRLIEAGKAPADIAVRSGYVYWTNYGSGTIERARTDGSGTV